MRFNSNRKRALIKHEINHITHIELEHATSNLNHCHDLIDSFSCTLSKHEDLIREITCQLDDALTLISEFQKTKTTPTVSNTNINTDIPFSFVDADLSNFSIEECTQNIQFEKIGMRKVAYFGNFPYEYSGKHHDPCEYPNTPVFKAMFDQIACTDKTFNPSKYTCLVTLMEDGDDCLGFHSDDEGCIVPDSIIYCASFGATRDIAYASKKDPKTEHRYSLPHGSVYCMSALSQRTWRHSIPADRSIKRPRVSFTFRVIKPPFDIESDVVRNDISPPFQAESDPSVSPALIPQSIGLVSIGTVLIINMYYF